jgi:hypothetical protein
MDWCNAVKGVHGARIAAAVSADVESRARYNIEGEGEYWE